MNESTSPITTDTTDNFKEISEAEFAAQTVDRQIETANKNSQPEQKFAIDELTQLWLHDKEFELIWNNIVTATQSISANPINYLNAINRLNLYLRSQFVFTTAEDVYAAIALLARLNGKIRNNSSHTTAEIVYAIDNLMEQPLPESLELHISQFNNLLRFFSQEAFEKPTDEKDVQPNNDTAKCFLAQEIAKTECAVDGNANLEEKTSYLLAHPDAAEYFCADKNFLHQLCQQRILLQRVIESGHMRILENMLKNDFLTIMLLELPYSTAKFLQDILQQRLAYPYVLKPDSAEMQTSNNPIIKTLRRENWRNVIDNSNSGQMIYDAYRGNPQEGTLLFNGEKYSPGCRFDQLPQKKEEFLNFIQQRLGIDRTEAEKITQYYHQGLQSTINAIDISPTSGLPFKKQWQVNIYCKEGKTLFCVDVWDIQQLTEDGRNVPVPGRIRIEYELSGAGFCLTEIKCTTELCKKLMLGDGNIELSAAELRSAKSDEQRWIQPTTPITLSSAESASANVSASVATPDTTFVPTGNIPTPETLAIEDFADRHDNQAEPFKTLLENRDVLAPLWGKVKQAATAQKPTILLKALRAFYLAVQQYLPQDNKISSAFWRDAITEAFGTMSAQAKTYCLGMAGNLMTIQNFGWLPLWRGTDKQIKTIYQDAIKDDLSQMASFLGHDSSSIRKLHLYDIGKTKPVDNFVKSLIALKVLRNKLTTAGADITHQQMRILLKEYRQACGLHLAVEDAAQLMQDFPQTAEFFLQRTNALERRLNSSVPAKNYRAKICKRPDLLDNLVNAKDARIYQAIIDTKLLKSSHLSAAARSKLPAQVDVADQEKLRSAFDIAKENLNAIPLKIHNFVLQLSNHKNTSIEISDKFLKLYDVCADAFIQLQVYEEILKNYYKKYLNLEKEITNAHKHYQEILKNYAKLIDKLRKLEEIIENKIGLKVLHKAQQKRLYSQPVKFDTAKEKELRAFLSANLLKDEITQYANSISNLPSHQSAKPAAALKWIADRGLRKALIEKFNLLGGQPVSEKILTTMVKMLNKELESGSITNHTKYMVFVSKHARENPAWSVFSLEREKFPALQASAVTCHTAAHIEASATMQHDPLTATVRVVS